MLLVFFALLPLHLKKQTRPLVFASRLGVRAAALTRRLTSTFGREPLSAFLFPGQNS